MKGIPSDKPPPGGKGERNMVKHNTIRYLAVSKSIIDKLLYEHKCVCQQMSSDPEIADKRSKPNPNSDKNLEKGVTEHE